MWLTSLPSYFKWDALFPFSCSTWQLLWLRVWDLSLFNPNKLTLEPYKEKKRQTNTKGEEQPKGLHFHLLRQGINAESKFKSIQLSISISLWSKVNYCHYYFNFYRIRTKGSWLMENVVFCLTTWCQEDVWIPKNKTDTSPNLMWKQALGFDQSQLGGSWWSPCIATPIMLRTLLVLGMTLMDFKLS